MSGVGKLVTSKCQNLMLPNVFQYIKTLIKSLAVLDAAVDKLL